MAFKDVYKEDEQFVILGNWITSFSDIWRKHENNPAAAILEASKYLEGIYDFGYESGVHHQNGDNLITLIKEEKQ